MSLYDKLKQAVALNSDSKATLEMYWHWAMDGLARTTFPPVNFLAA